MVSHNSQRCTHWTPFRITSVHCQISQSVSTVHCLPFSSTSTSLTISLVFEKIKIRKKTETVLGECVDSAARFIICMTTRQQCSWLQQQIAFLWLRPLFHVVPPAPHAAAAAASFVYATNACCIRAYRICCVFSWQSATRWWWLVTAVVVAVPFYCIWHPSTVIIAFWVHVWWVRWCDVRARAIASLIQFQYIAHSVYLLAFVPFRVRGFLEKWRMVSFLEIRFHERINFAIHHPICS